jgi:hypothetical protein
MRAWLWSTRTSPPGNVRPPCLSSVERHQAKFLPSRGELDFDESADVELTASPELGLTIDPDAATGDQRLGLAAVHDDTGELEQLTQPDAGFADLDVHPVSVAYRAETDAGHIACPRSVTG